ncbi:MAG: hypothetical protein JWL83_2914, partial [Actinomycetia bacterium]|nr:hypothetical protein [Actinomycetes bacterium]
AGKGNGKKAIADMYSMSHEITEWADDPYVNNVVPRWAQPGSGACFSNLLEGGDAIEALPIPAYVFKAQNLKWHPSDIAGISWFTRASPSTQQNHKYSYHGLLSAPATLC